MAPSCPLRLLHNDDKHLQILLPIRARTRCPRRHHNRLGHGPSHGRTSPILPQEPRSSHGYHHRGIISRRSLLSHRSRQDALQPPAELRLDSSYMRIHHPDHPHNVLLRHPSPSPSSKGPLPPPLRLQGTLIHRNNRRSIPHDIRLLRPFLLPPELRGRARNEQRARIILGLHLERRVLLRQNHPGHLG